MKTWRCSRYITLLFLLIFWICAIIVYRANAPVMALGHGSPGYIWIVDAGHGGCDGGAVSDAGVKESILNLDIALRVCDLARFLGKEAILTRDSEALDYPPEAVTLRSKKQWDTRRRAELVNSVPNALLISVHQNYYPSAIPSGCQVLYGKDEVSHLLGEHLQGLLTECTDPDNRRVADRAAENIYLMDHISCPAVLIECGFLSNPREAGLLVTESYRLRLSAGIAAGITQFTGDAL